MLKLIASIIIVTTSFSVNATTYTLPPIETCTLCNPPSLTLQQTKECVVINNKIKNLELKILQKEKTVDLYSQSDVNSFNLLVTNYQRLVNTWQLKCEGKSSFNVNQALKELNK